MTRNSQAQNGNSSLKPHLVMGDWLNFIIDHRLESVDAFDAILPIIIGSHIFTELSTFYAPEGNSGASGFFSFVRV